MIRIINGWTIERIRDDQIIIGPLQEILTAKNPPDDFNIVTIVQIKGGKLIVYDDSVQEFTNPAPIPLAVVKYLIDNA
jgi:hypothetical protein